MVDSRDLIQSRLSSQQPDDPKRQAALNNAKVAASETEAKVKKIKTQSDRDFYLHICAIWFLVGCGLVVFGLFVVLAWHLGAPDRWRFLTADEIEKLKTFVFSGTIGGALTGGATKLFK